ncbi:hypothetical protein BDQ17DRAFT_1323782 [Cyathus striatus]|nr:hypothetical protein BDQ17DRAFT_1323782 [Cyathus striatus]
MSRSITLSTLPSTGLALQRRHGGGDVERARKRRRVVDENQSFGSVGGGEPKIGFQPASPEDAKNFRRNMQIDMKGLVGDAVGNMSISPTSRDIVLAARRGLFIIDLDSPLELPRFLPQGGTWDVADVQWNPHPARAEYIVSTSSERMLIWNLLLVGKTSIEHILRAHYRAITDINWHTSECDVVASTGLDAWIWAWDLRVGTRAEGGGTVGSVGRWVLQVGRGGGTSEMELVGGRFASLCLGLVKWNRQDANVLASSHADEVLIWDRRKGSLPLARIHRTIKAWDINLLSQGTPTSDSFLSRSHSFCNSDYPPVDSSTYTETQRPKGIIRTTYPVWRARSLPFGQGVLSLPQRGDTTLEMYAQATHCVPGPEEECHMVPVETFPGHTDVVKEFVWRRGGRDDFQLITWSKDRTLRFWPIEKEIMNPPEGTEVLPALSAPVGNRGILAEVRAAPPPRPSGIGISLGVGGKGHEGGKDLVDLEATPKVPVAVPSGKHGETMSRGGTGAFGGKNMDPLAWLSNVREVGGGSRRGSSSGAGTSGSRCASIVQEEVDDAGSGVGVAGGRRSESRGREGEGTLQDEITSVLNRLSAVSKIKLEKHDLTKKRTCTLGLHGPWGDTSSVFIRITFTFPRGYPNDPTPPDVSLEHNPLISIQTRAFMLKRLRGIRQRKRPCFEPCLKFLLFGDEDGLPMDSSDEEESVGEEDKRKEDDTVALLLRNNKNLGEPRTSLGTFGPGGELVVFCRAPPRIVKKMLKIAEESPAAEEGKEQREPSIAQSQKEDSAGPPRLFQSPALLSDAVRRLGLAATDRVVKPVDGSRKLAEGGNILRIMTNLLTVPQNKIKRDSESSRALGEMPKSYALLPMLRSTVYVTNTTFIDGADRKVARDYVFAHDAGLRGVCEFNAGKAKEYGRYDHERAFRAIGCLFSQTGEAQTPGFASGLLAKQVIMQFYTYFAKNKDIQMLGMIATLILQTVHGHMVHPQHVAYPPTDVSSPTHLSIITPKLGPMDYFSIARSINSAVSPTSPPWNRAPTSPIAPPLAQSISSNSSRGSWSSLFNTGTVRQFVSGMQDSLRDGLTTPSEIVYTGGGSEGTTPMPRTSGGSAGSSTRGPDSPNPASTAKRRARKDSTLQATTPPTVSKSWNEGVQPHTRASTVSFSSAGSKRPSIFRLQEPSPFMQEKGIKTVFDYDFIGQLSAHIYVYAEILFRWQLFHKRLELLKSIQRIEEFPIVVERDKDRRSRI